MTVGTETFWNLSTGNGVTDTFGFTFPVSSTDDVVVLLDGVVAGNYTVSLTDPDNLSGGGNVVFDENFEPASGVEVLRIRRLKYLQSTSLPSQGAFNAKTVERAFDRVVMLTQQVSQRAPLIPETDLADGFDTEIAGPLTPGYALVVNADGDGFNFASTLSGATVSAAWAAVIESATLADGLSEAGLGTEDSPQFSTIELGHATENTLSASGGVLSVEGVQVVQCSGAQTVAGAKTFTDNIVISKSNPKLTFTDSGGADFSIEAGSNLLRLGQVGVAFICDFDATGVKLQRPLIANVQSLSGAGAVDLTTATTAFTSTGVGDALTLADGTVGQIKHIVHVAAGGSGVLTPTNLAGGTTITFTNAGDSATLQFLGTEWFVLALNGAVLA